ncbi:MAG TPA: protein TolR [Geobacteraceae bacterium]|nr:protein TolR [Geobacteraceae bacterium]
MEIGNRSNDRQVMSQINVTPFVDVMLVLLVIFMITAPMMQQGMQVNLPKTEAKAMTVKDEPIIVTIDRSGRAFLDKGEVPQGQLKAKLAALFASKSKKEVFLKADRDVPYGDVIRAMAEIKSAGVERLGMLTEPAGSK